VVWKVGNNPAQSKPGFDEPHAQHCPRAASGKLGKRQDVFENSEKRVSKNRTVNFRLQFEKVELDTIRKWTI
jgi:hypothetical protein